MGLINGIFKVLAFVFILLSVPTNTIAGTVCFPNCEFSCYFPGKAKVSKKYVGNMTVIQKQFYPNDSTLLKAECLPSRPTSKTEFVRMLKTQARLSNIKTPTISTKEERRLKVGIYSGNIKMAGYDTKLHGKVILGRKSTLHLIVIELRDKFPSKEAVNFLESYKLK